MQRVMLESARSASVSTSDQLVRAHMQLPYALARRFDHRGVERADLEQVAVEALIKASRRFQPDHGATFATYGTACILGELKRYFRDKAWGMRLPRAVQERYLQVGHSRDSLTHALGRSPTVAEIAADITATEESVLEAMEAGHNLRLASLDETRHGDESSAEIPEDDDGLSLALERTVVQALLPQLASRDRLILHRIYFDGYTQAQTATEMGLSQMQVSRVLRHILDTLRRHATQMD